MILLDLKGVREDGRGLGHDAAGAHEAPAHNVLAGLLPRGGAPAVRSHCHDDGVVSDGDVCGLSIHTLEARDVRVHRIAGVEPERVCAV